MRDCVNAEVRDRLPELVHGLLAGPEHAAVEAHVAECPDCAAEAALIRVAASSVALAAPKMNASRIAAALPAPVPQPHAPTRSAARGRMIGLAAALLVAVAGISTLQILRGDSSREVTSAERTLPQTGERAVARPVINGGTPPGYSVASARSGLVLVGGIDALTLDQLETLVSGVETLSYMPAADPDALSFTGSEEIR